MRSGTFRQWQPERKHRAPAGLVPARNPTVVVLDNPLANRESQTGPVDLTVRGEGLEQFPFHFRGEAGSGVLNLGDYLGRALLKPYEDFPSAGHRLGGVMGDVVENPAQAFRIDDQLL